ncbi:MAG TPA: SDR family NAD(P)-dependent oxidoreductase, partial [Thermomicrobiales bacterium]|nr:SDR family NAD(P)-dependent oxidoreductase [Thermomicrobiales bacterium]
QALRDLAAEIERAGGRALAVPTDVTDEASVQRLADTTIREFDRFDVWVNNAAVMSFGRFDDTPTDVIRRIMDTNFFGVVHGARSALRVFRSQGHGTLVNLSSLAGRAPQPDAAPYVASKHAVRSLGMNLRQELMLDGEKNIHVVTILPATIDTPLFNHVANYTGKRIVAPPPVYSADDVVEAIRKGIEKHEPEIFVGNASRTANLFMKLMPGQTERMATTLVKMQEKEGAHVPPTAGNLFGPSETPPTVSGGWKHEAPSKARKFALVGIAAAAIPIGRRVADRIQEARS